MKSMLLKNKKRIFNLLLMLFFPFIISAQDYSIQLKSRTFTPTENIASLTKSSNIFRESIFEETHYVIIQFKKLPTPQQKDALAAKGISLHEYIPSMAYTASVSAATNLSDVQSPLFRAIFNFLPKDKMAQEITDAQAPAHATALKGLVDVTIITYQKLAAAQIAPSLATIDARILEDLSAFQTFTIRVPEANVQQLAALPFVQWVEYIEAPNKLENTLGRSLHRVNELNDGVRNLKGDGVNVGIWDGGEVGSHIDFLPAGRITLVETSSASTHSTHCAGTITARGNLNPDARGMAPNAKLYSSNFNGNIQTEMAAGIPANTLVVSSHSYGSTQTCGVTGAGVSYSSTSRNTDLNLNNFPTHIHCHSAGNSQTACTGGWSTITGSGKTAKNNILVAALSTTDGLASFSSCGPVRDGRIKPEISAFGSNVLSTYPTNTYATISGTSMSTPGVAGSATLLVQRYKQLNSNALPPSSLIKNIILNTAEDLGNAGPDYRYGYGRINALEAAKVLETNRYELNSITTNGTNNKTITVPSGASKLRVMLTWNDPAGASNASAALVNNLDLSVINGTTTTLPWKVDENNPGAAAFRGVDVVSNIEQVTIDNPTSGSYTLRVNGLAVPTGPSQEYALTWWVETPAIEIIYPNGTENFNSGSSETIRWNNAGVTGNQTVQYSLNNGSSWTTLSSTVPASTRVYVWTPPSSANTSTALVRVVSGALTDQSDAAFSILNTPTNFSGVSGTSCNAGVVNFTWTSVANATSYDIYVLNTTTGYFDTLGTNITGTTFTGTGLPANTSMWFYIQSKNNTTGAKSKRSVAINVTTSGNGGSAAAPGAISGSTSICAPSSSENYSVNTVAGATSYTWAAPTGAFITGGQGTNSVSINYTSGSTSGNLSVTVTDGTCISSPSTLAITVNQTTPPATTGDTICENSTASLAATGSGTLAWYANPSGGNSIFTGPNYTTPALNSTTSYYVSNVNVAPNQSMGKADNSGGGANFNANRYLLFDAFVDMEIISVVVYAGSAGNRTIELRNSIGTPLQTATVNLISGMQTVTLNFSVPAGTDYQLGVSATSANIDMYRNDNGLSYPYNLAGIASITRSDAATNGGLSHYYFFYNWTVKGKDCESARATVTATVSPTPSVPTITTAHPVCISDSGSITITSPLGTSFEYSINGTNYQAATTFSPPAGLYNVTARIATTGCTSAATSTTINSNTNPCAPNVTVGTLAATPSILQGDSANLTYFINNTGNVPSSGTINILLSKPTNGTLTLTLPVGWTTGANTTSSILLTTNNIILPGLSNNVSIPAVYQHNGANETSVKTMSILASPLSGGETLTNDNQGATFIQVN